MDLFVCSCKIVFGGVYLAYAADRSPRQNGTAGPVRHSSGALRVTVRYAKIE